MSIPMSNVQAGGPPSSAMAEVGPPRWLVWMEQAHDRTLRAARVLESIKEPRVDLRPAAAAIERSLEAQYAVFDERGDRLEAAQAAINALNEASASLAPFGNQEEIEPALPFLHEARSSISAAQDPLSRMFPAPPRPPVDLRASKDTPTLHAPARPPFVPTVRVAPPPEAPPPEEAPPEVPDVKTVGELQDAIKEMKKRAEKRAADAKEAAEARKAEAKAAKPEGAVLEEVPPGFAAKIGKAVPHPDFIAMKGRELFEEVAMVGMQRTPLLGDPFRTCAFLERRLLCAVDALVGYGFEALSRIETMVIDFPAKDASRAFGAAMVMGCIDGRDALAAAERVLRYCGAGDPEVAKGFGDALKLVPHPALPTMLRTMLRDPDPDYRALALDVLAYRDLATGEEYVAALSDPSPRVAAIALPKLALMRWAGLPQAIDFATNHDDATLREAGWLAMAYSGHMHAVNVLEANMGTPYGDRAVEHIGILAESKDAERLLAKMQEGPTEATISAVGWAGHPASIPVLIAMLANRNVKKPGKIAVAYALDRITGARLYDSVEIDPEAIVVSEPPEPDVGDLDPKPKPQSLAEKVSDPRDLPGKGAADSMQQPTMNPERWKAWWKEASNLYQPHARYRRGHPYTPLISLWEMSDGWVVSPYERRLLQRELIVRTGEHVRFDPHDWIVIQEEALKQWEGPARRASGAAGQWARSMRRG
jgi:uncharacterized protein (TIGR02270 family)